jgi:multimeric flavodoxin WrbA
MGEGAEFMKVVAFNGSPRKEGNTYLLVQKVFGELQKERIETEIVQIGGKSLHGCTACQRCKENLDKKCALPDDGLNSYIEKMEKAEGKV